MCERCGGVGCMIERCGGVGCVRGVEVCDV